MPKFISYNPFDLKIICANLSWLISNYYHSTDCLTGKINKIKALTWAASAASCCAGTVKSCEIGEYYDSLTARY